ncbi:dTDP-glucose 4,6-dehydratase [Achromobacter insuavis]|uniref:dTDP-glucose 4,6-dehydratase n=1 Tax=Achromobacter insuavis TaxID=1287735 RepID=UPI001F1302B7|nr:dTDP-glucose 4,6-dehydratase [Achromobacter insuavis]
MTIIVTGGAGFIGSNFVIDWLDGQDEHVVTLDKLTYAGNPENLDALAGDPRHSFVQGDIADAALMRQLLLQHQPRALLNFAAESHVDRSIDSPEDFIQTNVVGTFRLLEAAHQYWKTLAGEARDAFRFLHVSTDEVYGTLLPDEAPFSENTRYAPNGLYAASKAASDHFVRGYHQTHGLPVLTTNCSNNYGPRQFPEKLIPLTIRNALAGKTIPIYGDGRQIRDWLYVSDHCRALQRVLEHGQPGRTYAIGSRTEKSNLDVVLSVCALLDRLRPLTGGATYQHQIRFVDDRPGHDRRYAINPSKTEREFHWHARETFETGLLKTVQWYLDHPAWGTHADLATPPRWLSGEPTDPTPSLE